MAWNENKGYFFPWRIILLMSRYLLSANLLPPAAMVEWPYEEDDIPDELLPLLAAKALTEKGMPDYLFPRIKEYALPDGMSWDSIPVCREFSVPVVMSDGVGTVAHFLITDSAEENKVIPDGLAPDAVEAAMNALRCAGGAHILWRRETTGIVAGPSLGLPVALAALGHGTNGPYFMATGGLKADGSLFEVEGVEEKRELALRCGAEFFLCPDVERDIPEKVLPIPSLSSAELLLSIRQGDPNKFNMLLSNGSQIGWFLLNTHERNNRKWKMKVIDKILYNIFQKKLIYSIGFALIMTICVTIYFYLDNKEITIYEANNYVGKIKTVCGTLNEINKKEKITFLNFGGKYPRNVFAGAIYEDDSYILDDINNKIGQKICLNGEIRRYGSKTGILLTDKIQIIKNK